MNDASDSLSARWSRWWPDGGLLGTGDFVEIDAPGADPPLLAIHGFGSTPDEVSPLTELAAELGLRRRAPLLPGHGTHARDLARTRYQDWYATAERELLRLSAHGRVIVGGQSLGSLISLDLALRHPERVLGLVILANATRLYAPYPDWALSLVGRLGLTGFMMPKFGGANLCDAEAKQRHLTYGQQPIRAALDVRERGIHLLGQLARIHCPCFVAHGEHDLVCPVSNAWAVAERLGTPDVELLLLPNSAHIITKDGDRELLRARLRAFLQRLGRVPNE